MRCRLSHPVIPSVAEESRGNENGRLFFPPCSLHVAEFFASLFYTLSFPKVAGKLASVARLKRIVAISFV